MRALKIVALLAAPQILGYYAVSNLQAAPEPHAVYAQSSLYFKTPERAAAEIVSLVQAKDWNRLAAYCAGPCAGLASAAVFELGAKARYDGEEALPAHGVTAVYITDSDLEMKRVRLILTQEPEGFRLKGPFQP